MNSRLERFLIALMFAVLFAITTLIIAQAKSPADETTQATAENCDVCHADFTMSWEGGSHGQAETDPVFTTAWTEQGKPGACLVCHVTGYDPSSGTWRETGVACDACHNPIPANHPAEDPMPIDRSTDLCGHCHSDTRFGWEDWQVSTHYQRGMACITCHDPHSAALKNVDVSDEQPAFEDASLLCITCHSEQSMDFPYSAHHQRGVSCVDCHVRHVEMSEDSAHSIPDHSFNASLETCNTCHSNQMHSLMSSTPSVETPEAVPDVTETAPSEIISEPNPVSPVGYAGMAGLIGLAVGMVLSPWLEKAYRNMNKGK